MSGTSAPSPAAYVATLAPFGLDSEPMRKIRLSARQVQALADLRVPIRLLSPSPFTPRTQAELQIADAVTRILDRRGISVALHRDEDAGDVSVWVGEWLTIADVELGLPAQAVAA